MYELLYFFP
jgi:hypothetical protein